MGNENEKIQGANCKSPSRPFRRKRECCIFRICWTPAFAGVTQLAILYAQPICNKTDNDIRWNVRRNQVSRCKRMDGAKTGKGISRANAQTNGNCGIGDGRRCDRELHRRQVNRLFHPRDEKSIRMAHQKARESCAPNSYGLFESLMVVALVMTSSAQR